MELRVFAVGDVVGDGGIRLLERRLRAIRKERNIDFVIVNGENASGVGLTPKQARQILAAGADVITLGNHAFSRREICPFLDDSDRILRPENRLQSLPGRGFGLFPTRAGDIGVVNLIGRCAMDFTPDNPFRVIEPVLRKLEGVPVLIDFHAEATSEKLAMAYFLDGRVSAVFGTHTHVQTADEQILPGGTGFLTDLGMTGPIRSVIGVRPEQSVAHFRGELGSRYEVAPGPCALMGAIFTLNYETRRCTSVERLREDKPT